MIGLGFEVKLISLAHVQAYVRRNKNDAADAAAICETATRPSQRFVSVRSIGNQAEPTPLSGARASGRPAHLAAQRVAVHMAEIGVVARRARNTPTRQAPCRQWFRCEWRDRGPRLRARRASPLVDQIDVIDATIGAIDKQLEAWVKTDETARRLMTILGIGPVTASAITATVQDMERLRLGARVLGLPRPTPRQSSTGGKERPRAHYENGRPLLAKASGGGRLRNRFAIAGDTTTPCAIGRARSSSARPSRTSSS